MELRPTDTAPDHAGATSPFEDWGDRDPSAQPRGLERWLIVVDGETVGALSAHPHYYGPNSGSMAMNIGITVLDERRGRGIGTQAQRQLAELLHARGVVRVEASTDITNVAEQRALAKAGFTMEGVVRQAQVRADGRHDLQLWAHIG
jgi:RimJ/RimL family protein N-acetyltransferase